MPSARGPRPRGVLTTRSTLPDEIRSTASTPRRPRRPSRRPCRPRSRALSSTAAVPAVAAIEKPSSANRRAATRPASLSRSASDRKTVPLLRQRVARAGLALGERHAERAVDAHHLAGRAHLRPEHRVDVGEAVERQHRFLHRRRDRLRPAGGAALRRGARRASRRPSARAATFASGTPVALLTNGTVRLARGFASMTNTLPSFTAYCTLSRPTTSSAPASARVCCSIVCSTGRGERRRRDRAGGVARVHAGLLDVLHDAADEALRRCGRAARRRRPRPRLRGSGR